MLYILWFIGQRILDQNMFAKNNDNIYVTQSLKINDYGMINVWYMIK